LQSKGKIYLLGSTINIYPEIKINKGDSIKYKDQTYYLVINSKKIDVDKNNDNLSKL
jgi:hypothetical protein